MKYSTTCRKVEVFEKLRPFPQKCCSQNRLLQSLLECSLDMWRGKRDTRLNVRTSPANASRPKNCTRRWQVDPTVTGAHQTQRLRNEKTHCSLILLLRRLSVNPLLTSLFPAGRSAFPHQITLRICFPLGSELHRRVGHHTTWHLGQFCASICAENGFKISNPWRRNRKNDSTDVSDRSSTVLWAIPLWQLLEHL